MYNEYPKNSFGGGRKLNKSGPHFGTAQKMWGWGSLISSGGGTPFLWGWP